MGWTRTGTIPQRLPRFHTIQVSHVAPTARARATDLDSWSADSAVPTFQARSRLPRENTELTDDELVGTIGKDAKAKEEKFKKIKSK